MWLTPKYSANVRVLQCVASGGVVCSVVSTMTLTCSLPKRWTLGPRGGSCSSPTTPAAANRWRHKSTVGREVRRSRAMRRLDKPVRASRQIRARSTTFWGVDGARTQASS